MNNLLILTLSIAIFYFLAIDEGCATPSSGGWYGPNKQINGNGRQQNAGTSNQQSRGGQQNHNRNSPASTSGQRTSTQTPSINRGTSQQFNRQNQGNNRRNQGNSPQRPTSSNAGRPTNYPGTSHTFNNPYPSTSGRDHGPKVARNNKKTTVAPYPTTNHARTRETGISQSTTMTTPNLPSHSDDSNDFVPFKSKKNKLQERAQTTELPISTTYIPTEAEKAITKYYMLAASWPPTHNKEKWFRSNSPWTIHGLWPQEKGSRLKYCPSELTSETVFKRIESIVADHKNKFNSWKDVRKPPNSQNGFSRHLLHQWEKHGTCFSSNRTRLTVDEYFSKAANLMTNLNIREKLTNSHFEPQNLMHALHIFDLIKAIWKVRPIIHCLKEPNKHPGLSEIRFCYNEKWTLINCPPLRDGSYIGEACTKVGYKMDNSKPPLVFY